MSLDLTARDAAGATLGASPFVEPVVRKNSSHVQLIGSMRDVSGIVA